MIILLEQAVKEKIIRPIDFYFSQFIAKTNTIAMLVSACLSYESRNGYIFLPIEYFKKNSFFSTSNKEFIKKIVIVLGKKINWSAELLKHSSVSDGSIITPLILYNKKIYLYKMWKAESNIFNMLHKNYKKNKINKKKCSQMLNNLFPNEKKSLQKIAVALTLINKITFIIGGPGTGKTTTIVKIIIALIKKSNKPINIQLSAPTGKATTRLSNMMQNNIFNSFLSKKEKKYLPSHAVTIHQLLGIQKISQKSLVNKNNLLSLDVLIIDETSMIDILMMEKIFFATSEKTKLIFIGDHNQLSPIESGSILRNICYYAHGGYSLKTISDLKKLINYKISKKIKTKKTNFISNNICILKKNYRFNKKSGIYTLSYAIKNKKIDIIQNLFQNSIKNIFFYEINSTQEYKKMIERISLNYEDFWNKINQQEKIEEIIKAFQSYQVLCILRDSLFGINFLNKTLEEKMRRTKKIKYFYINNQQWYIGKPIMITKNNKYLDLSNGNVGITNMSKNGFLQVSFLRENQTINNIPASILKNYETAWAITVHKAQGSEFTNTALILPNFDSNLLNKDILYTGITRSRNTLSIFSNKDIFIKTALKSTDK
ncbi:exodeoxyribonuclease V subunit alpha [Buchnera aphidicola (Hyperomyzus lactucae)]|uniref:RecBCD enzyme subunit RecD n=1 Tax=Buchnera aphidicola (Hyperomyzus lactucae) TaxID=1241860 RepID=A0A4D6Y444_9GAMM|nr:exodeoxyribonuclease V subunit alpha [Buchnera aphidicola]QCI21168.1 exodeoxyribonuclease V subunit alpha [Buchnera aphidicola (Hyperomyzus lactucae)]